MAFCWRTTHLTRLQGISYNDALLAVTLRCKYFHLQNQAEWRSAYKLVGLSFTTLLLLLFVNVNLSVIGLCVHYQKLQANAMFRINDMVRL